MTLASGNKCYEEKSSYLYWMLLNNIPSKLIQYTVCKAMGNVLHSSMFARNRISNDFFHFSDTIFLTFKGKFFDISSLVFILSTIIKKYRNYYCIVIESVMIFIAIGL